MDAPDSLSRSRTGRNDYANLAFGTPVLVDGALTQTASRVRGEIVGPNRFLLARTSQATARKTTSSAFKLVLEAL